MTTSPTAPKGLTTNTKISLTRGASPPKTLPAIDTSPVGQTSRGSSDYSPIEELSFDFTFDADGKYVRMSKPVHSSPPTPQDENEESESEGGYKEPAPSSHKPPSPVRVEPPITRATSLRSEDPHHAERLPASSNPLTASSRPPQRTTTRPVSSAPAASLGSAMPRSALSAASEPPNRMDRPQRVTLEEFREQEERNRRQVEQLRARMEERDNMINDDDGVIGGSQRHVSHEAPQLGVSRSTPGVLSTSSRSTRALRGSSNLGTHSSVNSRLLPPDVRERASVRQASSINRGKVLKSSGSGKYPLNSTSAANYDHMGSGGADNDHAYGHGYGEYDGHFAERDWAGEDVDNAETDRYHAHGTAIARERTQAGGVRPRRSASLDEGPPHEGHNSPGRAYVTSHNNQQPTVRPGTSLGLQSHRIASTSSGANPPRRSWEEKARMRNDSLPQDEQYHREYEPSERNTVSDPHTTLHHSSSPTQNNRSQRKPAYGHPRRDSDTLRNSKSQPQLHATQSPSPTPPPGEAVPARLSPSARTMPNGAHRSPFEDMRQSHRRSPTAPEPYPGAVTNPAGTAGPGKGKSWMAGEERAATGVDEYGMRTGGGNATATNMPVRGTRQIQPLQQAPVASSQASTSQRDNRNALMVNKKVFIRLDVLGKGGSSRVFRVMNTTNEIFAIKRVSLDKTDPETMNGYMNEIALLRRLDGNNRIIRLFDSEVKPGPGGTRGHLLLLMECGEIDMAKLMLEQQKEPMNLIWISYYWQQMLQAVHVIHEEKIVHSDLKPANFVLVRGQLKLIDFGIAKAIANDTTNIQRDHQVGTVNYMSPEAIELPDGTRRLKVGRPSDVWSLGCILYQMVYGQTPFQQLTVLQKMKAIPDREYVIDFPLYSTPSIPASPPGSTKPPKKLNHLRRPVRREVIDAMQSCLCRDPKSRSTIPELLEREWLACKELQNEPPPTPKISDLLASDETVISHHYMTQLLDYGIKLGMSRKNSMPPNELSSNAERLIEELKALYP